MFETETVATDSDGMHCGTVVCIFQGFPVMDKLLPGTGIVKIFVLAVAVFTLLCAPVRSEAKFTVFAAASMQNVMEDIIGAYERECDCSVVLSAAGTSALARQIEAGAPAAVFVSADMAWMDYLVERGAVQSDSVAVVAGNELVIAIPKSEEDVTDAKRLLGKGRFAMADPGGVPAGRYAKAALENLGIWNIIGSNAVFTENVRVALRMAARGDVDAAIVYASDVPLEPALHAGYKFAAELHPPIVYSAGQINENSGDAAQFLEFLQSVAAQALLHKSGFPTPVNAEN